MNQITETSKETTFPDAEPALLDKIPPGALRLIESTVDTGADKFFLYLLFTKKVTDAAKLAGISDSWAYKLSSQYNINPKLFEKLGEFGKQLKDQYVTANQLLLPDLMKAKIGAVKYLKDNPESYVKNPKMAEGVEKISGALAPDTVPQQVVNVDKMQVIIKNALGSE
jgi:phage terminase small subunit